TSGLSVGSLTLWVDGQGVVHRMAFTFLSYAKIAGSKPVSAAALLDYQRARRAQERTINRLNRYHVRTGKPIPQRPMQLAALRVQQAFNRAYRVRRGPQRTTPTVLSAFSPQPQPTPTPPHAIPPRGAQRLTSTHH